MAFKRLQHIELGDLKRHLASMSSIARHSVAKCGSIFARHFPSSVKLFANQLRGLTKVSGQVTLLGRRECVVSVVKLLVQLCSKVAGVLHLNVIRSSCHRL